MHTPFLLLYKAYTVELTGISTAPLKFGVVVAGQLHPLCDGGVAVAEHSDVKIYITIENIFHPVAHHIELQADVGYLIVLGGKRDLLRQAAGDSGLQHFRIVIAGIEGAQVFLEVGFSLGAVGVRIDGGAQVVQLHFGAVADVDAGDPHRGVQEQERDEHDDPDYKKAGKESDLAPLVAKRPAQP